MAQTYSRICPICGAHYLSSRPNANTCSNACRQEAYRRRKRYQHTYFDVTLSVEAKERLRQLQVTYPTATINDLVDAAITLFYQSDTTSGTLFGERTDLQNE